MTNLEAKQEAIKKAYGEFWETVKDYVDGNGWCSARRSIGFEKIISKLSWQTKVGNQYLWRPLSLKGIEKNNGWIKIESENDIPINESVWIFTDNYRILTSSKAVLNWILKNPGNKITHYQPIEEPMPPIF